MAIDLSEYRVSAQEQVRIRDLFELIPQRGARALDVGTRDGYLAKRLAERFDEVVALDLERPNIDHPGITPVKGDVAHLEFPDGHFDVVLCAEVLEHIPPALLATVCSELQRVSRDMVVIGVPYRQDLRLGRTTCAHCGRPNPPWGHVNSFDERRLEQLFSRCRVERSTFVGKTSTCSNALSCWLLDHAGNPYGTWEQDEPCVHCGEPIGQPAGRNLAQKIGTRIAMQLNRIQQRFTPPRGNWIHVGFRKIAHGPS